MREQVVAVAVALLGHDISVVVEAGAGSLVVVDHPYLVPYLLEEPDGGGVVPSEVPSGIDRKKFVPGHIADTA
ncbi:hypothetical protein LCGC14_2135940, partial [marine sediment metagenome]